MESRKSQVGPGEQVAWVIPHASKPRRYIAMASRGSSHDSPGYPFRWGGVTEALCLACQADAKAVFEWLEETYAVRPPVRRIVLSHLDEKEGPS